MSWREASIVATLLMIMIVGSKAFDQEPHECPPCDHQHCEEYIDFLEYANEKLDSAAVANLSWRDSVYRLKCAIGMPDSIEFNYETKCQYMELRGWHPNDNR